MNVHTKVMNVIKMPSVTTTLAVTLVHVLQGTEEMEGPATVEWMMKNPAWS